MTTSCRAASLAAACRASAATAGAAPLVAEQPVEPVNDDPNRRPPERERLIRAPGRGLCAASRTPPNPPARSELPKARACRLLGRPSATTSLAPSCPTPTRPRDIQTDRRRLPPTRRWPPHEVRERPPANVSRTPSTRSRVWRSRIAQSGPASGRCENAKRAPSSRTIEAQSMVPASAAAPLRLVRTARPKDHRPQRAGRGPSAVLHTRSWPVGEPGRQAAKGRAAMGSAARAVPLVRHRQGLAGGPPVAPDSGLIPTVFCCLVEVVGASDSRR